MTRSILTVCTADHFQHYIPMFLYCIRKWGKGVDTYIYVRGKLDDITKKALNTVKTDKDHIIEEAFLDYPFNVSTTNSLRFITIVPKAYDYTLIVDVDLLIMQDPFPWHIEKIMNTGLPFAGHRGPYHKPHRPEIAPSWTGDFGRVAGGFFCVTRAWWALVLEQQALQSIELFRGRMGHFREADEVMLGRIIRGSGLPAPTDKHFPTELRGVHLGDFKETMRHRWTSQAKMQSKLTNNNCYAYIELTRTPAWNEMVEILEEDMVLKQILQNVYIHIHERGLV